MWKYLLDGADDFRPKPFKIKELTAIKMDIF